MHVLAYHIPHFVKLYGNIQQFTDKVSELLQVSALFHVQYLFFGLLRGFKRIALMLRETTSPATMSIKGRKMT